MSQAQFDSFDSRLRKIDRRNRQLARGYVTSVNHDGLIIARPRRQARSFPWRGLLMILVALMAFKVFLYMQIGPTTYEERVIALSQGNVVEQIGAYAMTADPVTVWIASLFGGTL